MGSLTVYRGGAHTGKTSALFEQLKLHRDRGEHAILLVPEQATYAAERRLCGVLGGLLGGVKFNVSLWTKIGIFILSLIGYVTVTNAIAFRVKKVVLSTILTMMLFNMCFNSVMFGNAILSFMENETALKIGKIIYNIHSLGQWFSLTPFSFDFTNPGFGVMAALSVGVIVIASTLPMIGLKKRELK